MALFTNAPVDVYIRTTIAFSAVGGLTIVTVPAMAPPPASAKSTPLRVAPAGNRNTPVLCSTEVDLGG